MARIFRNTGEALNEIERDIVEMGIKVHPHTMQNKNVQNDDRFETKELQNYSFTILDLSDKDKYANLEWCKAEFQERITPEINPGEAYKLRADVWNEFLDEDGKFDYTYSERLNLFDQIEEVINELIENPDSRQCVIHVHYPGDIKVMQQKRVPCSMYYQLMIRGGSLDIIYNMRSSDFATHFKNDIWLADALRNHIAHRVGVPVGLFHMNIGSLHIYKGYGNHKHVF